MMEDENDTLMCKTQIFDVVKADEVQPGFRPVQVKSPDWAMVIAVNNGEVLAEKQLRFGKMKVFTELPCGMVEDGESPLHAIKRELAEEAGILADEQSFIKLGEMAANPAFMTNSMHFFFIDLSKCNWTQVSQSLDEHEKISLHWMKLAELKEKVKEENGSVFAGTAFWLLDEALKEGKEIVL